MNVNFYNLLGKNILFAEKNLNCIFEKSSDENIYYAFSPVKYGKGMQYNGTIILKTDEDDLINEVDINHGFVMGHEFYNKFVKCYGVPDSIKVIEKIEIIDQGRAKDSDFDQYLKKSFLKMKDGTFDENPLYMIWEKKDYQIKIVNRYEQNLTQIIFRRPTKIF